MKNLDSLKSQNVKCQNAIKEMDNIGLGFMTVIDENSNVVGVFTDGDFRRAVLDGMI